MSRLLCILALTLTITASGVQAAPNILLITSEDNGPELGCYGDPFVRTPHLDRLAAEGVRFERAFVATASCSESRAAILTGLYPHQNGQIGLAPIHRMYGETPNMVTHLRSRGYRTGLIGKLHVNPEPAFPFGYRPDVTDCNTFAQRDGRRVAELAGEFMTAEDKPFFLMVNYADAHLPFLRRQHGSPAAPLSGDDVRPLPWIGLNTPRLSGVQADYYNCLMRMDEGVGQLLATLDRAGLADETLVIYLGDHGAQFPRGKLASYESSLHVPLIIRWPGNLPAGETLSELVTTVDLLPTVLDAAGVGVSPKLPGRSLLPLSRGESVSGRQYLFAEYHAHIPAIYFPQRTVRDDRHKLILNLLQDRDNPVAASYSRNEKPAHPSYVSPSEVATGSQEVRDAYALWSEAPPIELYDLRDDPYEWRNLADDPKLASVKTRLLSELESWRRQTADPLLDPAKLAKLTAEHDAVVRDRIAPKDVQLHYAEYMAPSFEKAAK